MWAPLNLIPDLLLLYTILPLTNAPITGYVAAIIPPLPVEPDTSLPCIITPEASYVYVLVSANTNDGPMAPLIVFPITLFLKDDIFIPDGVPVTLVSQ